MLIKAFSTASAQRIKLTAFAMFQARKMTFPSFQICKCFCQLKRMSYCSSFTFSRYHCQIC